MADGNINTYGGGLTLSPETQQFAQYVANLPPQFARQAMTQAITSGKIKPSEVSLFQGMVENSQRMMAPQGGQQQYNPNLSSQGLHSQFGLDNQHGMPNIGPHQMPPSDSPQQAGLPSQAGGFQLNAAKGGIIAFDSGGDVGPALTADQQAAYFGNLNYNSLNQIGQQQLDKVNQEYTTAPSASAARGGLSTLPASFGMAQGGILSALGFPEYEEVGSPVPEFDRNPVYLDKILRSPTPDKYTYSHSDVPTPEPEGEQVRTVESKAIPSEINNKNPVDVNKVLRSSTPDKYTYSHSDVSTPEPEGEQVRKIARTEPPARRTGHSWSGEEPTSEPTSKSAATTAEGTTAEGAGATAEGAGATAEGAGVASKVAKGAKAASLGLRALQFAGKVATPVAIAAQGYDVGRGIYDIESQDPDHLRKFYGYQEASTPAGRFYQDVGLGTLAAAQHGVHNLNPVSLFSYIPGLEGLARYNVSDPYAGAKVSNDAPPAKTAPPAAPPVTPPPASQIRRDITSRPLSTTPLQAPKDNMTEMLLKEFEANRPNTYFPNQLEAIQKYNESQGIPAMFVHMNDVQQQNRSMIDQYRNELPKIAQRDFFAAMGAGPNTNNGIQNISEANLHSSATYRGGLASLNEMYKNQETAERYLADAMIASKRGDFTAADASVKAATLLQRSTIADLTSRQNNVDTNQERATANQLTNENRADAIRQRAEATDQLIQAKKAQLEAAGLTKGAAGQLMGEVERLRNKANKSTDPKEKAGFLKDSQNKEAEARRIVRISPEYITGVNTINAQGNYDIHSVVGGILNPQGQ